MSWLRRKKSTTTIIKLPAETERKKTISEREREKMKGKTKSYHNSRHWQLMTSNERNATR